MAYSLFNSGAAAAYANSFRQRNPYGGFDEIKSDLGKETFGKIPFLNFKAELDMAKAGLKEVGATHRQHITNEASKEITEMKYGDKGGGGSNAKKGVSPHARRWEWFGGQTLWWRDIEHASANAG